MDAHVARTAALLGGRNAERFSAGRESSSCQIFRERSLHDGGERWRNFLLAHIGVQDRFEIVADCDCGPPHVFSLAPTSPNGELHWWSMAIIARARPRETGRLGLCRAANIPGCEAIPGAGLPSPKIEFPRLVQRLVTLF